MNRKSVILRFSPGVASFVACIQMSVAGDVKSLKGTEVAAITLAANDFMRLNPKSDLKHFTVETTATADTIEIVFIPDQPGNREATDVGTGGETIYGPEMHYFVSTKQSKILRFNYSR